VETKVGEQVALVTDLTPKADTLDEIRKLLKAEDGENVIDKVTNLIEKIEGESKTAIKEFIRGLVEKKVKSTRGQALVHRLIGEMEADYEGPLNDDLKTKIEADFEAKIEEDESVKGLVGEMAGWPEEPAEGSSEDRARSGGTSLGGASRSGHSRGREMTGVVGSDAAVVRKTGNLTVRKVRL
jgi:hypothetical protein